MLVMLDHPRSTFIFWAREAGASHWVLTETSGKTCASSVPVCRQSG
jgi:hypothetical protein